MNTRHLKYIPDRIVVWFPERESYTATRKAFYYSDYKTKPACKTAAVKYAKQIEREIEEADAAYLEKGLVLIEENKRINRRILLERSGWPVIRRNCRFINTVSQKNLYTAWEAVVQIDGRSVTRMFSIETYGEEGAKAMAEEAREKLTVLKRQEVDERILRGDY